MDIKSIHRKYLNDKPYYYLLFSDNKPAKLITVKCDFNGFYHYIDNGREESIMCISWLLFESKEKLVEYWKKQRSGKTCPECKSIHIISFSPNQEKCTKCELTWYV